MCLASTAFPGQTPAKGTLQPGIKEHDGPSSVGVAPLDHHRVDRLAYVARPRTTSPWPRVQERVALRTHTPFGLPPLINPSLATAHWRMIGETYVDSIEA